MSEGSAAKIHAALIARIAGGALPPGAALAETALASEFGVSRTPVREALQRLAQDGLAERGARRAFVIRRPDPAAMAGLFEAVGEIEGAIAALAAHRMSEVERAGLEALLARGETLPGEDYPAHNLAFHDALRRGAGSPVLAEVLAGLELQTLPWRALNFSRDAGRSAQSRAEHRAIADAILARDAEAARRAMQAHVAGAFLALSHSNRNPPQTDPSHDA
ncbi:GntR family transcriptional regulator [Mangrovicoccus algicola]|uniref:GntR family transcriptional regulator n=1 Tax=Mangrovicoccus algicola TaxID=2771008 RepID=A0A8J6YZF7_9RHOB|nr:GntR family transcriptional regulator [Mangrovicoccus algicola]MBE3639529.1 GntR family transcriptional regulator [Mangrovicoccus algicola]